MPHSLAVVIDEFNLREGRTRSRAGMIDVRAIIYVERDSQKGIVIGHGGARLKHVGTTAQRQIERLLGTKVFLELGSRWPRTGSRTPSCSAGSASRKTFQNSVRPPAVGGTYV